MKIRGPKRTELIQQKDEDIKELEKTIQENLRIADDENTEPIIRERAREKAQENTAKKSELVKQREHLKKGLSLRERVKEIFKKYGFTATAVLLAGGTTIGVVVSSLTKGLKSVTKGVGNGLQDLGKKRLHSARPAGRDSELCVSHSRSGYLPSW